MSTFKITCLAENTTYRHNCLAQHGQSFLIETDKYKLLFDVGEVPGVVEYNLNQLGISLNEINDIVISHRHIDHMGALKDMLPKLNKQRLFLPLQLGIDDIKQHPYKYNFLNKNSDDKYNLAISTKDLSTIENYQHKTIVNHDGFKLYDSIFSTGCVGEPLAEQAIVIDQKNLGITLILGCSHPGVETLVEKAMEVTKNKKLRGIIGGMHYTDYSEEEMINHATNLKNMNPEFVMPAHCTTIQGCQILSKVIGKAVILSTTGSFGTGNTVIISEGIESQFV
jgi:7,8-dihydropterin-6-yl-methyl-4-(beta-D-ribofuranosyl)aminobenzene 5'-phosphate synthase